MRRRLLPDNVTAFRDRHGKERLRYRKTGQPTYYFKQPFGTEGFREELRACLDGVKLEIGRDRITPGTIADLINRFYRSTTYRQTGDAYQRKVRYLLEPFRADHGTKRVASIQFEHLDAIIADKASKFPVAAQSLRKILMRLFNFAKLCRMRPDNPVELVAQVKTKKTVGWRAWTEEEIEIYRSAYPFGTMARLAFEMYLWTGNRKADGLKLGRQHIRNGAFHIVQNKTDKPLVLPIPPTLAEAIMAMPHNGQLTLITTIYGKPFTPAGFGNRMRKWCDAIGLTDVSTHGLRKAISKRMAQSGAGNQGIKSITGHSGDSEVSHYTREADQEALARDTMKRLVAWEKANRKPELANANDKGL